jgi:amino acid transporter
VFDGLSTVQIIGLLSPLIIIQLGLIIFSIYRLLKDEVKYLPKWAWLIIIIFINLFGPIIFLAAGRVKD